MATTSTVKVAGRLALQGTAMWESYSEGVATATATRLSGAVASSAALITVDGTRICLGESFTSVSASLKADAIASPSTPAPASRTMRVPPEDRAMRVPFENRAMRVL